VAYGAGLAGAVISLDWFHCRLSGGEMQVSVDSGPMLITA